MTTNVTVFAAEGPTVVYFQDGSSIAIDEQQGNSFQVITGGVCTISDAPADASEHPPPGYAFAQAMVEFWQAMVEKAKAESVEVNPL